MVAHNTSKGPEIKATLNKQYEWLGPDRGIKIPEGFSCSARVSTRNTCRQRDGHLNWCIDELPARWTRRVALWFTIYWNCEILQKCILGGLCIIVCGGFGKASVALGVSYSGLCVLSNRWQTSNWVHYTGNIAAYILLNKFGFKTLCTIQFGLLLMKL